MPAMPDAVYPMPMPRAKPNKLTEPVGRRRDVSNVPPQMERGGLKTNYGPGVPLLPPPPPALQPAPTPVSAVSL